MRLLQVHGAIRKRVGLFVLFSPDVLDFSRFKTAPKRRRQPPEGEHVGMFDLVMAVHLLHHEFGIRSDLDASGPARAGQLESVNEGLIFGDVVGRGSDEAKMFGDEFAPAIHRMDAEA